MYVDVPILPRSPVDVVLSAQSRPRVKAAYKISPTHDASYSSETLSSLPKARPRNHAHFRMSDCFFVRFRFLSDFSVSLPLASALHLPTGSPWVHATNGTALPPRRRPDSLALLAPLTVSEFPGRNDPTAQNTNVCCALSFSRAAAGH